MAFWSVRNDFAIIGQIQKEDELIPHLNQKHPNILLIVTNPNETFMIDSFSKITNTFLGMKVILIGCDRSYETVRQCFLNGAFDYLIQPLDLKMLEESLIKIDVLLGTGYVINDLRMSVDALIDNIFLGGGQEEIIIKGIIDKIYEDWKKDPVSCQLIADKAKRQVYEILIDRKPWLEKFLYRDDFTYKFGFLLVSKEEIVSDWLKCFREASKMVLKYQMIDDKLVYKIGKYVVVHVDESLSLESVAKGVYLNPSYVSHIFKKVTGMSFIDYMAEVKMDRAKVLLRNPQIKIYDVASIIGYANPEYFSKIFKKKTGYSPVAYQKMMAELNNVDK
ncbi:MAG: helix-turn-helix domain-containing protein [Bacteroides sp.]